MPADHARRADRGGRGAAARARDPLRGGPRVRAAPQHRGAPRRPPGQRGALPRPALRVRHRVLLRPHRGRLRGGAHRDLPPGMGAAASPQRRPPHHRRLPRPLRARQRGDAALRRPDAVVPLDRLGGAGARALRPRGAHAGGRSGACLRRPRSPRITSPRRPGSRDRTASRWTTPPAGRPARARVRGARLRRLRRRPRALGGPGGRGDGGPGRLAAQERRARVRGAVAGPRVRDGGGAPRARALRVGGVPPGPHRSASRPRRRARGRSSTTRSGSGPSRSCWPATGSSPARSSTRPPTSSSSASGTTCSSRGRGPAQRGRRCGRGRAPARRRAGRGRASAGPRSVPAARS